MSKSTLLKVVSLLLGVFLCFAFIPTTFAQTGDEGTADQNELTGNHSKSDNIIHEVNPSYYDLYMQPGESNSFNVSFKNNDKKDLVIEPKVEAVPYSYSAIDKSWITISPANVTVGPGEEQEFNIEVDIPEDEDGGTYATYIAFTDDVSEDGTYVNALHLSIWVPINPKIALQTGYISDSIDAGEEYTYTVKIKNIANRDITIDPELNSYMYDSFNEFGLDKDAIEITAPSKLSPNEIADMVIRVPVPEDATGTYNGYIDMKVDGKENEGIEPQLSLDFRIKQKLSAPYVKTFTTTNANPINIEISSYVYSSGSWLRSPAKDKNPFFELSLKHDSSPVNMNLVKITQKGNVNFGWNNFPIWTEEDNPYYEDNGYYIETYTVPGAVGNWELEILPINADTFEYSITIGNSN